MFFFFIFLFYLFFFQAEDGIRYLVRSRGLGDVYKRQGLYNETVLGKSEKVGDEFSFSAGGGAHYSNQKLVELIPNKKIQWFVTDLSLIHI